MEKMKYTCDFDFMSDVPSDWEVRKMRQVFTYRKGLGITKENLVEEGIPVISYGQVHSKINKGTGIVDELYRYVSEEYLKTRYNDCRTNKGDFIFADTSEDYEGVGNCALIDRDEVIFAGYHSIIASPINEKVFSGYMAYLFLTDYWRNQIRSEAMGIKVYSVTQKILRNTWVVIPSVKEQQAIAEFLDNRCSQIDGIIADIEKQIEVLKKYKKSLITETVTKGLNKDIPMKDSGVEWIGEIPEKWETKRVLYLLEQPITDGPHETPEMMESGIPFVSAEAVSEGNGRIDFERIWGYISQEYYKLCCKKYTPKLDDIYMIKSGATTGKVAIVDTEEVFTIWSPLAVFRSDKKKLFPKFLLYSLQADYFQMQVKLGWTYGTQQNIGMRTLEHLKICVPSLKEQEYIVDFLDIQCTQIDTLIASKQTQLEKMQGYRKSLIYEYVTGKKRVTL